MRFAFSEDQELLRTALRAFLEKEHAPELVRSLWSSKSGRSPKLWKQLAEMGVVGALLPETAQGLGLDEIATTLLQEEAGRAALAEPLVSTAAVGAPLVQALAEANDDLGRWLEPVATGDAMLAIGHPVSPFVCDAHVADLLLLAHGEDEIHAFAHDRVEATAEPATDPSRRLFSVRFEPSAETCVARGELARRLLADALDRGALACAAQQIGVAERLLEMAVAYAGDRQQFGKPIGSFQAIKHALADVKIGLEYARPLVHRAAHSVARGHGRRSLHVSMAKSSADEASHRASRTALQVHGAIGYTWEQDLHIWMRRSASLSRSWGSEAFHRARVGEALLQGALPIGPGTTFLEE